MKEVFHQPKHVWAIRDLLHGKTFYFESLQEMIEFVLKFNIKE